MAMFTRCVNMFVYTNMESCKTLLMLLITDHILGADAASLRTDACHSLPPSEFSYSACSSVLPGLAVTAIPLTGCLWLICSNYYFCIAQKHFSY